MTLHSVAIIGARGHTGAELIRMVDAHSSLELVLVSSREHDGQQVSDHVDGFTGSLRYVCADAEAVARKAADVVVLSGNIEACPADEIGELDVAMTIAGGRITWRA